MVYLWLVSAHFIFIYPWSSCIKLDAKFIGRPFFPSFTFSRSPYGFHSCGMLTSQFRALWLSKPSFSLCFHINLFMVCSKSSVKIHRKKGNVPSSASQNPINYRNKFHANGWVINMNMIVFLLLCIVSWGFTNLSTVGTWNTWNHYEYWY